MEDLTDGIFRPIIRLILGVLRVFQFIAWDLMCSYVGWSIGWCFYRFFSLGRYPVEGLNELDNAHWVTELVVDLTGLILLAGFIYFLSSLL